jgi:hypothetical protein
MSHDPIDKHKSIDPSLGLDRARATLRDHPCSTAHHKYPPYAGAVSGVATLTRAEGTIWVAEHTRLGMSLMT